MLTNACVSGIQTVFYFMGLGLSKQLTYSAWHSGWSFQPV